MRKNNLTENKLKRNCPSCNKLLKYSSFKTFNYANQLHSLCLGCTTSKRYEKITILERLCSNPQNNINCKKTLTYKTRTSYLTARNKSGVCKSCNSFSKNNPFYGKSFSEKTIYKMRLKAIENLRKKGIKMGYKGAGNYNSKACEYIDKLNKENGWNLQHALNGGEVEIYGYFVDGYDKEKNIIFEYDELGHNTQKRKLKDIIRQNNIISYLKENNINVNFWRYDEKNNNLYNII